MSTAPPPIVLRNPGRLVVPLVTAALVVLMFVPPLLLVDLRRGHPIKLGIGISLLLLCALWLARSAWRAPFELAVGDGLTIRRLMRQQRYDVGDVRRWFFSVPDGPPTADAPGTNALLTIVFADRTRFRGEVTAAEAARIAAMLRAAAGDAPVTARQ